MDLKILYDDLLRDIGVSASLCGFHGPATTIYKFGIAVDESNPKTIEALVLAELMQENVDFALAEAKRWESNYQARTQLLALKSMLYCVAGLPYDAVHLFDKLKSLGEDDLAEGLRLMCEYAENKNR